MTIRPTEKTIILTLRLSRFGARRYAVLAAR
jgi:hypothetical protein